MSKKDIKKNKTPIRYAGGKSRAIKHIIPYLPQNLTHIVSPFIGGGSFEVYLTNMNIRVTGFDIFKPLTTFWKELIHNNLNFTNFLKTIDPTVENYKIVKEKLMQWEYTQEMLKDWKTDFYIRETPIKLSDVEIASYYYFNHNTSYGPGYLGWPSSVYLNPKKWIQMIQDINKFQTNLLEVEQGDFIDIIETYPNDFLYLDPPYFMGNDTDNKMHAAIYPMKNIPVHHDGFKHEKLRDLLHNHKGNFIMSYNNCETIREYYKDFRLEYPKWNYSMGNGETRIGENRIREGIVNSKDSHEILIIKE
jgi:DNA adenine methylase